MSTFRPVWIVRPHGTRYVPTEPNSEIGAAIPFPPGSTFRFLSLPLEIRTKIYRMLYRSSVPMHPIIESTKARRNPPADINGVIPKTVFPTNLLLTNRQIYAEATAVLWGDNQIVLQFPLDFQTEYGRRTWYVGDYYYPRNAFSRGKGFIPNSLHLRQIHNLIIEVYLFRTDRSSTPVTTPPRPSTLVKRELTSLCDTLKEGHQLRQVEIRFTNLRPHNNPNHVQHFFPAVAHGKLAGTVGDPFPLGWSPSCCGFTGRHVCGKQIRKIGEIQELCRLALEGDQRVLEPLLGLRGIETVKVKGRTTDEWAQYLKRSMESQAGVEMGDFEPQDMAQRADSIRGDIEG